MSIKFSTQIHKKLNLKIEKLPENYEITTDENNFLIAKKNNKFIHSKYSIEKECKEALKDLKENSKNIIIFSGIGLGLSLNYLFSNENFYLKNKEHIKIILLIEDITLFSYIYSKNKLKISDKFDIYIFELNENNQNIINIIDIENFKGINTIHLNSLSKEEKHISKIIHINLMKNIEQKISDTITKMHFENIWSKNILKNITVLSSSSDISVVRNIFNGKKAILIGAGPTLEDSIKEIKKHKEYLIIIAIDTAYSFLLKNNIVPHFILSADGGLFNVYDFIYERGSFPFLVMDLILNEKVKNIKPQNTSILTYSSTESLNIIKSIKENTNIKITPLLMRNTIATTLIDFSCYLGLSEILLIGFDNSYPYYYTHVKHSLSYEYYVEKTNKLNTLESYYYNSIKKRANIENYPPFDFTFENQIEYFNNLNKNYKNMKIKRITSKAIEIKSIEEGKIEDFLSKNNYNEALDIIKKHCEDNFNEDIKNLKTLMEKTLNILKCLKETSMEMYNEVTKNAEKIDLQEKYLNEIYKNLAYNKENALNDIFLNIIILSKRTKNSIFEKNLFLLSQTIKNTNYFITRIKEVIANI